MPEEELGDGAGMSRQELPVRAASIMMLNLLNHLLGREFSMAGRRPGADSDQACDLSHLQPQAAKKQEVAGDPRTGIVPVTVLEELKCCLEDGPLLII